VCSEKCSTGFATLRIDLSDSASYYTCGRECFNLSITKNNVREKMKTHMFCEIVRGYVEISELSNYFCYLEDSIVRKGVNKILSSIVEIDGYLRITNSSLITDLRFFTNLKRITGKTFHSGNYSMILTNNGNHYVWLPNQNVTIEQGSNLIESNTNLCQNCQIFKEVEIKPQSYTATVSWKIPTFLNASEAQNYELFIWNGTDDYICSSRKM
jgi:Receptor L domain